MTTIIHTFLDVDIRPNSLVICDLDETLLKFSDIDKQWWIDHFNSHFKLSNNYDDADNKTYLEWIDYVQHNMPSHTDFDGFSKMLEKIHKSNSKLIFLTARNCALEKITHKHLISLQINPLDFEIYFSHLMPKGKYLCEFVDFGQFEHIIFIDDLLTNIYNVLECLNLKKSSDESKFNKIKTFHTYQFLI